MVQQQQDQDNFKLDIKYCASAKVKGSAERNAFFAKISNLRLKGISTDLRPDLEAPMESLQNLVTEFSLHRFPRSYRNALLIPPGNVRRFQIIV